MVDPGPTVLTGELVCVFNAVVEPARKKLNGNAMSH